MRFKFFTPPLAGKSIAVVILSIFVLSATARAQTNSTLTGDVRDAAGAFIEGAQVRAKNLETGLVRDVVSDDEGRYIFPSLPVGEYEVRAEKSGFKHYVYERIVLTVNETATLNIPMAVTSLDETVTVTDGRRSSKRRPS